MSLTVSLSFHSISILRFTFLALFSSAAYAADGDALNQQQKVHIRTLAASCAACHGTQGNSHSVTPVLASLDASYFSKEMIAFKNGSRPSTVMHHHAKGLTTIEISQLADYFSQQERISKASPKPQTLKVQHE
jgi:cytochrome subunit of sulfide dehydrogenase